jgi:hypothetical protein
MQVILIAKKSLDLALLPHRYEPWYREAPLQLGHDVVALDVDLTVDHEGRDQASRIDPEIPIPIVLI